MLTPTYIFTDDFSALEGFFLSRPHVRRNFRVGGQLWASGEAFGRIH